MADWFLIFLATVLWISIELHFTSCFAHLPKPRTGPRDSAWAPCTDYPTLHPLPTRYTFSWPLHFILFEDLFPQTFHRIILTILQCCYFAIIAFPIPSTFSLMLPASSSASLVIDSASSPLFAFVPAALVVVFVAFLFLVGFFLGSSALPPPRDCFFPRVRRRVISFCFLLLPECAERHAFCKVRQFHPTTSAPVLP